MRASNPDFAARRMSSPFSVPAQPIPGTVWISNSSGKLAASFLGTDSSRSNFIRSTWHGPRGLLNEPERLFSADARELVQKFVEPVSCFQMFVQSPDRNAGPTKHRGTAKNSRIPAYDTAFHVGLMRSDTTHPMIPPGMACRLGSPWHVSPGVIQAGREFSVVDLTPRGRGVRRTG